MAYATPSVRLECSPTTVHYCTIHGFGTVFYARVLSTPNRSTSELLRTL